MIGSQSIIIKLLEANSLFYWFIYRVSPSVHRIFGVRMKLVAS